MYIIKCETDCQFRFDETGCSGLVHWDDPEGLGWGVRWEGFQDGEQMYTRG